MKKIIGALLVGAMIGGVAFADLNSSLNVRTGMTVFQKADTSADAVDWFKLGTDDVGGDTIVFQLASEYAGVRIDQQILVKGYDGGTNGKKILSDGTQAMAYVKPAEWLKLQIGAHKDGIFWVEQCKKDWDDTNLSAQGAFAGFYKPGTITDNSTAFQLDTLGTSMNSGRQYFMANFTLKDVGPGNLGIDFALTNAKTNEFTTDATEDVKMHASPALRVSYTAKNMFKANVDLLMLTDNDLAAGLYFSPLMVKNLTGLLGYSFSTTFDKDKGGFKHTVGKDNVTFSAIDLRLRYVMDKLSISNSFNVTFASEDAQVKPNKGLATKTNANANSAIWDSLMLLYKFNDKVWAGADVQLQAAICKDDTLMDMWLTPFVVYTVGKGAAITGGLNVAISDMTDKTAAGTVTGISIPVIFRVKM